MGMIKLMYKFLYQFVENTPETIIILSAFKSVEAQDA
jgi:hypothetical protein